MFNLAAGLSHIFASNFKKKNYFTNKLSLFLKVNHNKQVLMLRKLCKSILNKEIPLEINDIQRMLLSKLSKIE